MGWGQWMVPELRDSQLFALRALELELRDTIRSNPDEVIRLCVALSQQCQMQASIIRKASGRIAELEVGQAIAQAIATAAGPITPAAGE
jgi:hypothetical protein